MRMFSVLCSARSLCTQIIYICFYVYLIYAHFHSGRNEKEINFVFAPVPPSMFFFAAPHRVFIAIDILFALNVHI